MQEPEKTRITYERTLDHFVAYNIYYARTSPTLKKQRQRHTIFSGITMFILGAFCFHIFLFKENFIMTLFGATLCAVFMVAYHTYYYKYGDIKRIRRLAPKEIADNSYPGMLGEHTLEIDAEGITHKSAFSQTQHSWGAIKKVETDGEYTYIFMGSGAFILHPDSILSGDIQEFLKAMYKYHPSLANNTPSLLA